MRVKETQKTGIRTLCFINVPDKLTNNNDFVRVKIESGLEENRGIHVTKITGAKTMNFVFFIY